MITRGMQPDDLEPTPTQEDEIQYHKDIEAFQSEMEINPPDWKWADGLFNDSDWAEEFDPEESDYNPLTGNYFYIDAGGNVITVTANGDVVLGDVEEK